jgi:hypothetical protein
MNKVKVRCKNRINRAFQRDSAGQPRHCIRYRTCSGGLSPKAAQDEQDFQSFSTGRQKAMPLTFFDFLRVLRASVVN